MEPSKKVFFSPLFSISPGLVQVAERGADDLLDLALVDVDAGAESGGLGESSVGDETEGSPMATTISSTRRRSTEKAAAAAVSAAAARYRGAGASARKKRACCRSRQHRSLE